MEEGMKITIIATGIACIMTLSTGLIVGHQLGQKSILDKVVESVVDSSANVESPDGNYKVTLDCLQKNGQRECYLTINEGDAIPVEDLVSGNYKR
jgi:hypothetical protein